MGSVWSHALALCLLSITDIDKYNNVGAFRSHPTEILGLISH